MKVLLVCSAGMSTSILMNKMIKYAKEKGIVLEITARGSGDYLSISKDYECILLGPQISYQKDKITQESHKPVGVIAPLDYGLGNCENIFAQVTRLISK